jgi:hypothetical protein
VDAPVTTIWTTYLVLEALVLLGGLLGHLWARWRRWGLENVLPTVFAFCGTLVLLGAFVLTVIVHGYVEAAFG